MFLSANAHCKSKIISKRNLRRIKKLSLYANKWLTLAVDKPLISLKNSGGPDLVQRAT
jgi:hypothetical protein